MAADRQTTYSNNSGVIDTIAATVKVVNNPAFRNSNMVITNTSDNYGFIRFDSENWILVPANYTLTLRKIKITDDVWAKPGIASPDLFITLW